jgi:hypothetical protein
VDGRSKGNSLTPHVDRHFSTRILPIAAFECSSDFKMTHRRRKRTKQKNRDALRKLVSSGQVSEENLNLYINVEIGDTSAAGCEQGTSENTDISDGKFY